MPGRSSQTFSNQVPIKVLKIMDPLILTTQTRFINISQLQAYSYLYIGAIRVLKESRFEIFCIILKVSLVTLELKGAFGNISLFSFKIRCLDGVYI